jgi:cell division protein FtsL
MEIDLKKLMKRLWALPRVFRIMAAVVALDLVILGVSAFMLESEVDDQAEQVAQLKGKLTAQQQEVGITRKQIGRLPELHRLYDQAISNGLLAVPDRLKMVEHVHSLGERLQLSDVHYKLAIEQTTPIAKSKFLLVATPVTLGNSAILDTDVMTFWRELLGSLPAHYQIEKASIERDGTEPETAVEAIRAGRPTSMVKAEVTFRWMSLRKIPDAAKAGGATAVAPVPGPQTAAVANPPGGTSP